MLRILLKYENNRSMKLTIILALLILPISPPNDPKMDILKAWIETQNDGSEQAINAFIDTYFPPELLSKMTNRKDHVAFYRQIIEEFGDVQDFIYKEEENSRTKLKVQLLKKGQTLVPEPAPDQILVIEIDVLEKEPKFLAKGLGMGALICYIKR